MASRLWRGRERGKISPMLKILRTLLAVSLFLVVPGGGVADGDIDCADAHAPEAAHADHEMHGDAPHDHACGDDDCPCNPLLCSVGGTATALPGPEPSGAENAARAPAARLTSRLSAASPDKLLRPPIPA